MGADVNNDNKPIAGCWVAIRVDVTADDVENIMCDAAMFGSWWGRLRMMDGHIIRAIVVDPDRPLPRWKGYRITPKMVAKAIADLIDNGFDANYPSGALAEFAVTGEFGGGYDSVVADAILQQAMFGEVVYG